MNEKDTANMETTLEEDLQFIERYQAHLDLFREIYRQLFILLGEEIDTLIALSAEESECGNA